MRYGILFRSISAAALLLMLAGEANAQGKDVSTRGDEERAVRETIDGFQNAFNKRDVATMTSLWTKDGDFIGDDGVRIHFRENLADRPEAKADETPPRLALVPILIRFVTPEVATVDGRTVFRAADATSSVHGRFTAGLVKREGKWLIDSVREAKISKGSHHAHLEELAWLVGDWVEAGDHPHFASSVRWSDDGNYLLREFNATLPGRGKLHGTQRIGWDPRAGKIRSWTFNDDGSFASGLWTEEKGTWTADTLTIAADGTARVSRNEFTRDDENTITWTSSESTIDGQQLPDLERKIVHKLPAKSTTTETPRRAPAPVRE